MFDQFKDFNYRSLLTTRRFMSLAIVVAVVSILIVILGIIPQVQNILEVQQQVASETKTVEALQRKATELQELPSSALFAQADQLNAALPSQKPLLQLLGSLQAAGGQAQVNFAEVDITPGSLASQSGTTTEGTSVVNRAARTSGGGRAQPGPYDTLDVDLTVSGTTEQINQFFNLIERVTPITTITSISLQKQNRPNQPGTFFSADLRVTTYYFTQSILAAAEAPLPPITPEDEAIVNDITDFVTAPVQVQTEVTGGGLNDLFGLSTDQ